MREVLARSDHDFILPEPRRRGRSRRPNGPGPLRRFFRLVRRVADYPNQIAGTLLVGLIIAICVNALVLQQSRHPAPLFRKSFALPASVRQAQAATAAPTVAAQPTRDPIDQLLQSTAAPVLKSNAAQTPAEESKTVLAAQRALVKLGFALKPDGIIGGATRQAIEQFERDRGLPVHGELSPKVLHELSAQSGVAIE